MSAGSWLTRRHRRIIRRVYEGELQNLHSSLTRLGVESPEWPVKDTALEIVAKADTALRLNQHLRQHGLEEPLRLGRAEA